jgi:tripartite-type tricarboxylate transporter receptor subunit TctC
MKFPTPSPLRSLLLTLFFVMSLAALTPAIAQTNYPDRPIRLVVGYPPGGSVDFAARIVGEALALALKATVVIENQGGAAGAIAAQRVVSSAPDGYTLLLGSSNELAGTGAVNPNQKYNALKDFTPLGLVATAPVLLVAGPKTSVKTLDDFIKAVKSNPGKFSYGSSGVGSSLHFSAELLKQQANLFMTHIPYRGVAPLTSDLVGGGIEFAIMSVPAYKGFMSDGRLTALGVTSSQRLPSFPKIPAIGEHPLLKGYELNGWFTLMGPSNMPAEVAQKLTNALQVILADPTVRQKLEGGGNVVATGKENLNEIMSKEAVKLRKIADFARMRDQ